MNYRKIKPGIAVIGILAISMAACNNQNDSYVSSDTATTTINSDTMATVPALSDSLTTVPADTAATEKSKSVTISKPAKKYKATVETVSLPKTVKYNKGVSGAYDYAEVMPSFPGGQDALENYINNHINYPQNAIDDSKEGRVEVKFTVDENGKVMYVKKAGTELGDGLDNEAVRVVSNMPAWKAGTIKGKPVKVNMTLPIVFKIEE